MAENWYARLGVPEPSAGENAQEVAEPAQTDTDDGGKAQEFAEPAATDVNGTPIEPAGTELVGENTEVVGEHTTEDGMEMSKEERRQQAAARKEREAQEAQRLRQAEIDRAVEKAREETRKEVEEMFFKNSGIKNPYTDEPVTNMKQWQEYQAALSTAKLAGDLKSGNLTPEGLQDALTNLPLIKNIINSANEQTQNAKKAQENASRAEFVVKRDREMADIRKLNPAIQSLNDIMAMPTGAKFADAVRKGLGFYDAYRLANFEDIQAKNRAAGEQAARNAAAGLQHQQRTQQQGQGQVSVPASVKAMYKRLIPDITDAEIAREYNRSKK